MSGFDTFNLEANIESALTKMGYNEPTPIQLQTLPIILKGTNVLGLAETGSGKTAACGIPICQKIDVTRKVPQALVLLPTRELALQYAEELQKIGAHKKVVTFGVLGGEDIQLQKAKLAHGVHVIVATPGRLLDLIYSKALCLANINMVALDEADKMLSMGFAEDVSFILDILVSEYQFLMFSATMPAELRKIVESHIKEFEEVNLISKKKLPSKLKHFQYFCQPQDKFPSLLKLIDDKQPKQSMIFCISRVECEKVYRLLEKQLEKVDYLHGGISQNIRAMVMKKFQTGAIRHLVVTDVAGRGLDFKGVSHVFIYTLTRDFEAYVHRSGRTARYDSEGECITLITPRDLRTLSALLKKIGQDSCWIGKMPKNFSDQKSQAPEELSHKEKKPFKKEKRPTHSLQKTEEKPKEKIASRTLPRVKRAILPPPKFVPGLGLNQKKASHSESDDKA